MRRRVLLRVGVLAGVVLAGALVVLPDLRWWAWGRLRGEAFYRGRPTSYFAEKMRTNEVVFRCEPGSDLIRQVATRPPAATSVPGPKTLHPLLGPSPSLPGEVVLFDLNDGKQIVPVLADLLEDEDAVVVTVAAECLEDIGPAAQSAAPTLVERLKAEDPAARRAVALALRQIAPPADDAGPPGPPEEQGVEQRNEEFLTFFERGQAWREGKAFLNSLYPAESEAVLRGEEVLRLVHVSVPRQRLAERVKPFLGRRVAFFGFVAPPGGNADLLLEGGVTLRVQLAPPGDPRPPHAVSWSATVLGTLKAVDVKSRTIYIRADPRNWHACDTT